MHRVELSPRDTTLLIQEYDEYMQTLSAECKDIIETRRDFLCYTPKDWERKQNSTAPLMLDIEASYSITEQHLAEAITSFLVSTLRADPGQLVVTDATACVGGNTLSFARHFARVNAVEINPTRAKYLWHILSVLCPQRNVTVFNNDYTSIFAELQQDIVFLDPPWGGPSYKQNDSLHLFLGAHNIIDVCRQIAPRARLIAIKAPCNYVFDYFTHEMSDLGDIHCEPMGPRKKPKFYLITVRVKPATLQQTGAQQSA